MRLRFPRAARLTRAGEFRRVREQGRSWGGPFFVLGRLRLETPAATRVGFITSRRVGGAVVRNRVRRRLRDLVRQHRPRLRPGFWIVLIARQPAACASADALAAEWLRLAGRAGILRADESAAHGNAGNPHPTGSGPA